MSRRLLLAAALSAAAVSPLAALAAEPFSLKSVSVELPESDQMFPDGPGAEAINDNCLACHSAGMVLNQPPLPKAAWAAEVDKMIHTFKAPVDAADVPAIVDYLYRIKGKS